MTLLGIIGLLARALILKAKFSDVDQVHGQKHDDHFLYRDKLQLHFKIFLAIAIPGLETLIS